ncbi:Transmembrane amino acid transporter protein [Trichomonas vaginalis G3]|uniref:Transmembrane amino acid transporter protein n=1 Tax=Trichomonas vaginalis (strain ATCC PRA-98 / G3) TaxID=412133 RepID=A2DH42_TRIV3|nr:amino acid transmembrane transporter protein [Trichomonas vaginalis G3]EAY20352.1 Transmembrane amino acid transporter protein [Trichomonas vaginalis G3]KAI5530657.1 amino acid transmembrane transporter protein [Trichomonas vaginalis G3]|eukprot:XP_001581338.1 Transmembrane amino acid transporter protein [Trichomonas vaginalis G3]
MDIQDQPLEDLGDEAPEVIGADGLPHEQEEQTVKVEDVILDNPQGATVGPDGQPAIDPSKTFKGEGNPNRVRRFATIMNLLNSLLGAGLLGAPATFKYGGVIPSILMLALVALVSYYATVIVVKLQLDTKSAGFDEICVKVLGKWGQVSVSIFELIFLYSCTISYLIFGSRVLIAWLELAGANFTKSYFIKRAALVLGYSLILPIALTIPRSIGFLSYFSTATVFFIFFFVIGITVKSSILLAQEKKVHETVKMAIGSVDIFTAMGVYFLAFALPVVSCSIVQNYNVEYRKRKIVTVWAEVLCLGIMILPSLLAYLCFGSTIESGVLERFDSKDILINLIKAGIFFVVSFSYPCLMQPVLGSFGQIIYKNSDAPNLPLCQRIVCEIVGNAIAVIIAMVYESANTVLGVGGALGGCVSNFIYPAIMYLVLYKPSVKTIKFWLVAALAVFGIVSAIIATVTSIISAVKEFKK